MSNLHDESLSSSHHSPTADSLFDFRSTYSLFSIGEIVRNHYVHVIWKQHFCFVASGRFRLWAVRVISHHRHLYSGVFRAGYNCLQWSTNAFSAVFFHLNLAQRKSSSLYFRFFCWDNVSSKRICDMRVLAMSVAWIGYNWLWSWSIKLWKIDKIFNAWAHERTCKIHPRGYKISGRYSVYGCNRNYLLSDRVTAQLIGAEWNAKYEMSMTNSQCILER